MSHLSGDLSGCPSSEPMQSVLWWLLQRAKYYCKGQDPVERGNAPVSCERTCWCEGSLPQRGGTTWLTVAYKHRLFTYTHTQNHTQYPQCISKGHTHTSTVLHKQSDCPVCEVFFGTATYNSHIPFHSFSSFHTSRRRKVMCTRTHSHAHCEHGRTHFCWLQRAVTHILTVVGGAASGQRKVFANVVWGRNAVRMCAKSYGYAQCNVCDGG